MGNILIPGGGGGADLDVITADAGDVLAPKVIVDRDGEPVTGTLALSGNAAPWDVRPGRTFYATDPKAKQTGTMAERGAAAFTPGRFNQVIGANQFLVGDQTIWGDWNLAPENIKKGVTIFGVMGSWEGWVPTPQDLYYNGVNSAGFIAKVSALFQNTQIYIDPPRMGACELLSFSKSYDIRSYSRLIFEGKFIARTDVVFIIKPPGSLSVCSTKVSTDDTRLVADIAQLTSLEAGYMICGGGYYTGTYITRIRLE